MEDIIPLKDIKTDRNTQNNEQPSQSSEVADERPKMRSYFSIEVESEDDLDSFDESKRAISSRFKVYADCALFVQAKRNKKICRFCNKSKEDHDKTDGKEPMVPTDSFGQIEFMKASRKTRAKYLRLADRTDINDVIYLLKEKWGLPDLPKLLISVIGANSTLTWPSIVEKKIQIGLQKIAESTKPWVITSGLDCGITEYVSNTLQGHKYNSTKLIGVTTWGIVAGRECLRALDSLKLAEAKHFFPKYPPIDPLDIAMKGRTRDDEYFLNSQHGHFLLVDTGEHGIPNREYHFRTKLERAITKEQIKSLPKVFKRHNQVKRLRSSDYNSKYIPAIQVVIGGTPETIEHVALTLSADEPGREIVMAVVVVAESGQAANLLVKAYELCDEGPISGLAEKKLMNEIQCSFPEITDPQKCLKLFRLLLKIMKKKQDITIFYSEKEDSFDEAILLQLMRRGSQGSLPQEATASHRINPDYINLHFVAQLELTMIWNRADIAKKEILKDMKFSFHPVELEELMCWAILENKTAMVELLLDSGFDIKSFDHDKLGQSYYKKYIEKESLLKKYMRLKEDGIITFGFKKQGKGNSLDYIGSKEGEAKKCLNLRYVRDSFMHLCGNDLVPQYWKPGYQGWEKLKQPFNEIFLWSVLCNMQQMAILFWKRGDEVLAKALMARNLYQSMIIRCHDENVYVDEKTIKELENNSQEFGNLALNLLDVCTRTDRTLTKSLLCAPLPNWGNQSCIKLAEASKFRDFIAHPACQNVVAERWLGQLKLCGNRVSFKVIIALLFFPVAFMYEYTGQATGKKTFCGFLKRKLTEYFQFITAPITKFWMNVFSFLIFLGMFGYVMYTKFESRPSNIEWVVVLIVISLAMEEVRQIVQGRGIFMHQLIYSWWSSATNKLDLVGIVMFFAGFAFRMVGTPVYMEVGRVIYALDLMVWILRLLYFFSVSQTLGPYVVMIVKMTVDVFYFAVILGVFLLSYGVGRYAILEPNGEWSIANLRQFLLIPYFQIYGETFLEPFENSKNETILRTTYRNDYTEAVVLVVMVIYFLLTNLLLVNLLIAVFNNTFVQVQTNSERVWKWQWYCLVEEYIERPVAVPPFIIISHVAQIILYIWKKYKCSGKCSQICNCVCSQKRTPKDKQSINFLEHNTSSKFLRRYRQQKLKYGSALEEKEKIMFELMHFEEDCQLMLVKDMQESGWTKQERQLDEMKDRTNQVEDLLHTVLSEMEKVNVKLNKLGNDTNSIAQRLARVEKQNKFMQIPKGSLRDSPRTGTSPVRTTFQRLVSRNNETGMVSTQSNQPLPNDKQSVSENLLPLIEELSSKTENTEKDEPSTQQTVNLLSRSLRYPFSDVNRFYFPDSMVDWKVEFPAYQPKQYTSHAILAGLLDTDKEMGQEFKFNAIDGSVDRRSFCGEYEVINGRPRNPIGRTGIVGRGCLRRFGPNHIVEPILTRNKSENEHGSFNGFEVLVVEDEKEGTYSLPSGEVGPKHKLPAKLRKFFSESTLRQLGLSGMTLTATITAFESCFIITEKNISVFEGYLDCEKNTDNAWIETSVVNYHEWNSSILYKFFLNESAVESLKLRWVDMKEDISMPEYQLEYLRLVAEKRGVSFQCM